MKNLIKLFYIITITIITIVHSNSAEKVDYLKTDWSFKGLFGKFDRGSLQRGYQVYTEVCASCHSMKYLSYRNLGEKGGPEFSEAETKAIAASFEVIDGPNADGEMFSKRHNGCRAFHRPQPDRSFPPLDGARIFEILSDSEFLRRQGRSSGGHGCSLPI